MLTLSTHDTKRADDVRARLCVLSEDPDGFMQAVQRWHDLSTSYRSDEVDPGTEWFLFQTLIGAWPIDINRLKAYMQKAMREAKVHTSWVANDLEYEDALNGYMEKLLTDPAFCSDMGAFVKGLLPAAWKNSLTQTLLKHTSPGVPDMYQGGELWDLSLVDPDNRRPVDYALRSKLLDGMEQMTAAEIAGRMEEGLPKLWLVHRALTLRNEHPEWFGAEAAYAPVSATGADAERVVAYLRGDAVLTIAPRWNHGHETMRANITLPEGHWRDWLTNETYNGGSQKIAEMLTSFPVSLLVREQA